MKHYLIILTVALLWKMSKKAGVLDKDEMDDWYFTGLVDLGKVPREEDVQDITDLTIEYLKLKGGK